VLRLLPQQARVPIVQGPLRGYRWVVGSGVHGYWLGSYEWDKRQVFEATIQPGDVVFDVGANVGFYTLLAAKLVGNTGRVFAFEPAPRNLHYLRQHLALNRVRNAAIWSVAVADRSGTLSFDAGPNSHMGRISTSGEFTVQAVSLDELVTHEDLPPPNVIKMDIEGGEVQALVGARTVLTNHKPIILLATHGASVHQACCELLANCGYALRPVVAGATLASTDEIVACPS